MEATFYLDQDMTIDTLAELDVCHVTITTTDGSTVRLEGDYKDIVHLTGVLYKDFPAGADAKGGHAAIGRQVYKTRTTTLDEIDAKIDNLEGLLTEHRKGEERRYPDDFQVGDWVQFPPSHSWRQVHKVKEGPVNTDRYVIYKFGGVNYPQQVRAATRYPYCPADRFAEVCDR